MSEQKQPLGEAMRAADASWTSDFAVPEARAIIAVRDWLLPEEAEPTGMRPCGDTYSAQSIKRGERQRLRALLTDEAYRAERGDQTTSQERLEIDQ